MTSPITFASGRFFRHTITAFSRYIPLLASIGACHTAQPGNVVPSQSDSLEARVRTILSQALPTLSGKRPVLTMLEVTYGPGGFSPPHRHPCPVIGYVLEGALRSRVNQAEETVVRAGEAFYEEPNAIHQVSANASDRLPVRFIAYFLCERQGPLSIAAPEGSP